MFVEVDPHLLHDGASRTKAAGRHVGTGVVHPSAWAVALFVGAAVVLLAATAWGFFVKDPGGERRLFWWSWVIGGVLLAASLSERGPRAALAALLATAVVAVSFAFFKTSFLKIGGRVYALDPERRHPDPPRPSPVER